MAITASYQVGFEAFAARGLGTADTEALLRASVRLAAEARDEVAREDAAGAGRDRWIAASVGPYGATLGDGSEYAGSSGLTRDELRRWHAPRFAVLADAGADLLACETIPSLDEGRALVDLARGSGASAWLAFTVEGGRLRSGEPMAAGFALADEADEVVAVGINCAHPEEVPAAIAAARSVTDRPVVVYPNSGERWDAVARAWGGDPALPAVDAWIRAGASLVGGCCRVGPDESRGCGTRWAEAARARRRPAPARGRAVVACGSASGGDPGGSGARDRLAEAVGERRGGTAEEAREVARLVVELAGARGGVEAHDEADGALVEAGAAEDPRVLLRGHLRDGDGLAEDAGDRLREVVLRPALVARELEGLAGERVVEGRDRGGLGELGDGGARDAAVAGAREERAGLLHGVDRAGVVLRVPAVAEERDGHARGGEHLLGGLVLARDEELGGGGAEDARVEDPADARGLRGLDDGGVLRHALADLAAGDEHEGVAGLDRGGDAVGVGVLEARGADALRGEVGEGLRTARGGEHVGCGGAAGEEGRDDARSEAAGGGGDDDGHGMPFESSEVRYAGVNDSVDEYLPTEGYPLSGKLCDVTQMSFRVSRDRPGVTEGRYPANCPSRTLLDHITSKWGVLVLLALGERSRRWGELRREVEGISEKMLASTLRTLADDGLVLREAQPTIPPRVDYRLTELGHEVSARLVPLMDLVMDITEDTSPLASRRP